MKYFAALILLCSCTGSTEFGDCVGFGPDSRKPELKYEVSTRNAMWSIIGWETIIAPVLWATDYAYCPVGKK